MSTNNIGVKKRKSLFLLHANIIYYMYLDKYFKLIVITPYMTYSKTYLNEFPNSKHAVVSLFT